VSIEQRIESLAPWREPFTFDGVDTLPPERFEKATARLAARKSIFFDPLVRSGFIRNKRVLDLGANAGYWSLECLDAGASFVRGVETDHQRHAQARFVREQRDISAERYDLVHDDVYHHLSGGEQFDVVLCLGLYYHIEEPVRLMRLMQKSTRDLLIIDTVVSSVDEASISVRPCGEKERYLEASNVGLELVVSPKALYWIGMEAGFADVGMLEYSNPAFPGMSDYLNGQRTTFVLSQEKLSLRSVFPEVKELGYLTPTEDLRKYGHYPEMTRRGRAESPTDTRSTGPCAPVEHRRRWTSRLRARAGILRRRLGRRR
jgi:Protein of unknown function (DUF1698)